MRSLLILLAIVVQQDDVSRVFENTIKESPLKVTGKLFGEQPSPQVSTFTAFVDGDVLIVQAETDKCKYEIFKNRKVIHRMDGKNVEPGIGFPCVFHRDALLLFDLNRLRNCIGGAEVIGKSGKYHLIFDPKKILDESFYLDKTKLKEEGSVRKVKVILGIQKDKLGPCKIVLYKFRGSPKTRTKEEEKEENEREETSTDAKSSGQEYINLYQLEFEPLKGKMPELPKELQSSLDYFPVEKGYTWRYKSKDKIVTKKVVDKKEIGFIVRTDSGDEIWRVSSKSINIYSGITLMLSLPLEAGEKLIVNDKEYDAKVEFTTMQIDSKKTECIKISSNVGTWYLAKGIGLYKFELEGVSYEFAGFNRAKEGDYFKITGFERPIYQKGRKWVYLATFSDRNGKITLTDLVTYTVEKEKVSIEYKSSTDIIEYSRVTETKDQIALPPPGNEKFMFTIISPYPSLALPLKAGSSWSAKLKIPKNFDPWTGKEVTTDYKIIGVTELKIKLGLISDCWLVEASSKGVENIKAHIYFHEQYGFLLIEYERKDGSKLALECQSIHK